MCSLHVSSVLALALAGLWCQSSSMCGLCLFVNLSVSGWYPVGSVLAGLYSVPPLDQVVAPSPPPGMATRLCFSVEYRHGGEQLTVSLLRLGDLPPRFHGNVTLVELRLLPDDRRPRQAKARGTGPDPEFNDCFVFQVSTQRCVRSALTHTHISATFSMCLCSSGVSSVCVSEHPECVCAECEAGRQTARCGQGAVSSEGRARPGRQGSLEGAGD